MMESEAVGELESCTVKRSTGEARAGSIHTASKAKVARFASMAKRMA